LVTRRIVCKLKTMIDIFSISTNELVVKMRNGDISSVDVCKAYIDRTNKYEKDVKAWSFLDKKNLLEKAEEADEYRKSGKPIGPLHGLPIAVKDIIATYDMPTECGTVLRKKISGNADAEVVNLIKAAGAIIMGKTVTTEFAYFDPGKTTNPHDYTRTPGGSSSGSAAAVAAHMVPLAIGTQTNGSVIRPASYCGVVGYKPSFGLISRTGVLKQSSKLDHVGVFGKTVEDVALLSRSLIKKDILDEDTIHYAANEMLEV
jgi:Asp-tRNA(Asn)/Glu-tRNA(Gln) amidotransferase A subunit family amidase